MVKELQRTKRQPLSTIIEENDLMLQIPTRQDDIVEDLKALELSEKVNRPTRLLAEFLCTEQSGFKVEDEAATLTTPLPIVESFMWPPLSSSSAETAAPSAKLGPLQAILNRPTAWLSRQTTLRAVLADVVDLGKPIMCSTSPQSSKATHGVLSARYSSHFRRFEQVRVNEGRHMHERLRRTVEYGITKTSHLREKHSRSIRKTLDRQRRVQRNLAIAQAAWENNLASDFRSVTLSDSKRLICGSDGKIQMGDCSF